MLATTLVLLAIAGWGAATVTSRFTNGSHVFFGSDSPSIRAIGPVERVAGTDTQAAAVALVRTAGPIGAPAARAKVRRVVEVMRGQPGVARVRSVLEEPVRPTGGRARSRAQDPALTSADGRATYVSAFFAPGRRVRRERAIDRMREQLARVPSVTFADNERGYADIDQQVSADLPRIEMIAVPLLLFLSFLVFRSLIAAALPLLVAAVAVAMTLLGLRGLVELGPVTSFALNLSTGLGLGLAIDYALLMVSRYREEMARHGPGMPALVPTLAGAGRTVVFSASTVALSLLCLLVLPLPGLRSMAAAGALVAVCAGMAALLPMAALLALLGERVNALAPARLQRSAQRAAQPTTQGPWYRIAHAVMRRPGLVTVGCVALLLVAAAPAPRANLGLSDLRSLPPGNPTSQVNAAIADEFPGDVAEPIFALPASSTSASQRGSYVARVRSLPGAYRVEVDRSLITVIARGAPHGPSAQRLVSDMHALHPQFPVAITGSAAINDDGQRQVSRRLPLAILLLSLSTLAVLLVMTRSVLLPLKAVLMNAVTAAATLGLLVVIFQDGGLAGPLGFQTTHFLDQNTVLLLLFLVLGLSTDYGVFLLARIKEVHDSGAGNREAIARGLERSGRIVTAAALLFCIAVGSSGMSNVLVVKEFGIGAALAVLIDATIVRVLLVPALMALLGEANWWAPRPLRRFSIGSWPRSLRRTPSPPT